MAYIEHILNILLEHIFLYKIEILCEIKQSKFTVV